MRQIENKERNKPVKQTNK